MPVRYLSSSVLKWPDKQIVCNALKAWIKIEIKRHPGLKRFGYFGSYARGDWGVGSDLDLIAIIDETSLPFEQRNLDWDLLSLPVPAELIVYTIKEWETLSKGKNAFLKTIKEETVWIKLF